MGKMERAKKVCELYLEGKTKEEIAEAVGCNPSSINHYLRSGGISRHRTIESAIPLILEMRNQDKPLKEICEATGFGVNAVSRVLNKRGMGYKKHNLDFSEPDMSKLTFADRKPKTYRVEYDGKQYIDITELCGI